MAKQYTEKELDFLASRIADLAESNSEFRRQFDDLLVESQTDQPPNGDGYECLQTIREGIDELSENHVCVVCGNNPVNPNDGEDTCRWCLRNV